MKRWLYVGLGFLSLAALAGAGIEYLGRTRVDPVVREYKKIQNSYLELFLEDQTFLKSNALFKPRSKPATDATEDISDIGAVLNSRLSWQPQPANAPAQPNRIPKVLTEKILRYRGDWMRHHSQLFKGNPPDLSLFENLEAFQIWDIEKIGPIAKLIEAGEFVVPGAIPIPDSIELLTLAKLRLAAGAEYKTPLLALKQVRQLAALLLTTENIHLFATGLSFLDMERVALRYYVDSGLIKESEWIAVPRNFTRRAARAVWGARGYFHAWTDPKIIEKVFLSPELPVGFCAAVNEAAPKELSLRPMFVNKWPLERDISASFLLLEKVVARAKENCRLRYLTKMLELNRLEASFPVPGFLTSLPYSRKIFGLRVATLPFIGFEAYRENETR